MEKKQVIGGLLDSTQTELLLSSIPEHQLHQLIERLKLFLEKNGTVKAVPVEVFSTKLSPAEALVKFLKENHNQTFSQISHITKRDQRGIWCSYHRAQKKQSEKFSIVNSKKLIPYPVFASRPLSILECVVKYLKDNGHSISAISEILNKKPSTIYTVHSRAKVKNGE